MPIYYVLSYNYPEYSVEFEAVYDNLENAFNDAKEIFEETDIETCIVLAKMNMKSTRLYSHCHKAAFGCNNPNRLWKFEKNGGAK